MTRLGAVGTASTHLAHFARELGADTAIVRALALPGDPAETPPGVDLCREPEGFADGLDGIVLLTRDGRNHLAEALPYLQRGLPVFVDKPLACDSTSAERLLRAGRIASFSVLRFARELDALGEADAPREIRVPCDGGSPHAGFWFLGIHGSELACALGGPVRVTAVDREDGALRARLDGDRGAFDLVLDPRAEDYTISTTEKQVVLDVAHAYRQGARQLKRFFAGEPVMEEADMLTPIALLEDLISRA